MANTAELRKKADGKCILGECHHRLKLPSRPPESQ